MTVMPITPAHAKPVSRRDHLWVLAIVAAFALYDVWGGWTNLGNKSGFGHGTGWTLTVIVEAYWMYALFAWLGATPGNRSRRFAMWSAAGVFVLSLIGQGASRLAAHSMPSPPVVVFVATLPVTVLGLLAVLVHLRHLDRAEAEQVAEAAARAAEEAAMERAEADERVALRAQLAELRDEMSDTVAAFRAETSAAVTARDEAEQQAAKAEARAETLTRKLAAAGGRKRGGSGRREQTRKPAGATGPGAVSDVDAEALVLKYLDEGHSASKAGVMAGLSDSRGRQIARKLASAAPRGQDEERRA